METTHDRGDKILTGPEPGDLVGLECVRVSTVESTRADTSERDRERKRAALTLLISLTVSARRSGGCTYSAWGDMSMSHSRQAPAAHTTGSALPHHRFNGGRYNGLKP